MTPKLLQLAQNLCRDDEEIGGLNWDLCTELQRKRYVKKAEEILIFVLRDPWRPALRKVAERHGVPFPFLAQAWREIIDLITE